MKSSPRVRSGKQYRAERGASRAKDFNTSREFPEIFRKNPGPHHRHVLHVKHVRSFLSILPQWNELAVGLNAILLAPHKTGCDGFHRPGLVAICAQPRSLRFAVPDWYVQAHRALFKHLNVCVEKTPEGVVITHTESSLRGFQLLHILLHELGHHHDRMTTRSRKRASRGEGFAESYANIHGELIRGRYLDLSAEW